MRASEYIGMMMQNLDPDNLEEIPRWRFFNAILMGMVPNPKLTPRQEELFGALLSRVNCNSYEAGLGSDFARDEWALKIISWINGAHVANRLG